MCLVTSRRMAGASHPRIVATAVPPCVYRRFDWGQDNTQERVTKMDTVELNLGVAHPRFGVSSSGQRPQECPHNCLIHDLGFETFQNALGRNTNLLPKDFMLKAWPCDNVWLISVLF